jgi:hypothetical protein
VSNQTEKSSRFCSQFLSYRSLIRIRLKNKLKRSFILCHVSNALFAYLFNDEKLFSIVSNYEYAAAQPENDLTEYAEEEEAALIGEVSDAPVEPETSVETQPAETTVPEQTTEGIVIPDKMQDQTETVEKEVKKITFKQYKEILWDNFEKQYKIVIAQSIVAK